MPIRGERQAKTFQAPTRSSSKATNHWLFRSGPSLEETDSGSVLFWSWTNSEEFHFHERLLSRDVTCTVSEPESEPFHPAFRRKRLIHMLRLPAEF
jgi:hypothetical protein